MKQLLKYIVLTLVSALLGFIVFRFIISNLIIKFSPTMAIYDWVNIGALILVSTFILFSLVQIINKRISKVFIYFMWGLYFLVLGFGLFGRRSGYTNLNLNPFDFIKGLREFSYLRMILIMNIVLFIPLGYLFRNRKAIFSFVSMILILISIEMLQYITKRGIFDIDDIIFNFMGFLIGFISIKLIKKIGKL